MTLSPEIFREYDIRGVVGRDLTEEVVERIGGAFATLGRQRGISSVVVGRDNRLSSEPFLKRLVQALSRAGMAVLDIGVVTTPMLYYAQKHYAQESGIMITGSHNPADMNGLKMVMGEGALYGADIQTLLSLAQEGNFPTGDGSVRHLDPVPDYLRMLTEKIRLPRPLKVVVDCGSGTASFFAPTFLSMLGCEVIPLYCESDPTFPHHFPDPTEPKNMVDLQKRVLEEKADVGVAFDGDADRLGAVDDRGRVVWGDILMALFWQEILPKHPGIPAIVEVKCSDALVEEIRRLGGEPFFYRTGHSLIKAKMRELGSPFTGEMSGHLFFADEFFGFDDGIYAAGRLLRLLASQERSFSELVDEVPRYVSTPETRVACPDGVKFRVVQETTEHFRALHPVVDVDGVRVLFPEGWGLIRASNTQPVLVLRAEAKSPEALVRIARALEEALARHPEVGPVAWELPA